MVLNAIFDFGIWLFELIAVNFPASQPVLYSASNLFSELLSFGIWVIGHDFWFHAIITIAAWLSFRLSWGIVVFVWKLLPFT